MRLVSTVGLSVSRCPPLFSAVISVVYMVLFMLLGSCMTCDSSNIGKRGNSRIANRESHARMDGCAQCRVNSSPSNNIEAVLHVIVVMVEPLAFYLP